MKSISPQGLLFIALLLAICTSHVNCAKAHDLKVIIMSTSKFWFNFRQATNTLLIYEVLKSNGVKDEDIILMIPDNAACNSRNNNPGVICHLDNESQPNLYRNAEIDYKSTDVNVYTLTNMLRGRYSRYRQINYTRISYKFDQTPQKEIYQHLKQYHLKTLKDILKNKYAYKQQTPRSKRLVTNKNTKILTYFTGHGGNGYIKMQDTDVMMDEELKTVLDESYIKNFYNEMLMFSDSCSAATLYEKLSSETSPNIFAIGSSSRGQYSYSHGRDTFLNLSVVDRFTRANYFFFVNQFLKNKELVLSDLMKEWSYDYLSGNFSFTNTHSKKDQGNIYLKDFFSNLNPLTQNTIEMVEKDHHFEQLSSLLGEISALPTVDYKIENKPFI